MQEISTFDTAKALKEITGTDKLKTRPQAIGSTSTGKKSENKLTEWTKTYYVYECTANDKTKGIFMKPRKQTHPRKTWPPKEFNNLLA